MHSPSRAMNAEGTVDMICTIAKKYSTDEDVVRVFLEDTAHSALIILARYSESPVDWELLTGALTKKAKERNVPGRKGPKVEYSVRNVRKVLDQLEPRGSSVPLLQDTANNSERTKSTYTATAGENRTSCKRSFRSLSITDEAPADSTPSKRQCSSAIANVAGTGSGVESPTATAQSVGFSGLLSTPSATTIMGKHSLRESAAVEGVFPSPGDRTGFDRDTVTAIDDDDAPTPATRRPLWHCSDDSLASLQPETCVKGEALNGILRLLQVSHGIAMIDSICLPNNAEYGSAMLLALLHLKPKSDSCESSDVDSHHWVLAVIPGERSSVTILDSLPSDEEYRLLAQEKALEIYRRCFHKEIAPEAILYASPMPQYTGHDCGVNAAVAAIFEATEKKMPCGQPDSTAWREVFAIVLGGLTDLERHYIVSGGEPPAAVPAEGLSGSDIVGAIATLNLPLGDAAGCTEAIRKFKLEQRKATLDALQLFPATYKLERGLAPSVELINDIIVQIWAEQRGADGPTLEQLREVELRWGRVKGHLSRQSDRRRRLHQWLSWLEG